MLQSSNQGQSDESIQQNIKYFGDNLEAYNNNIQKLDTYITLRSYINKAILGINHLLDIGNGGVFDYDVTLVNQIVGLDLFLDQLPSTFVCPPNVTLKSGSALEIPLPQDSFDGVLMVMLIHHLVGKNVAASIENTQRAIDQAHRVLKPGGKMIIVESCVPAWFYQLEKILFPLAVRVIDKLTGHPATLQYPAKMLQKMLDKKFSKTQVTNVPIGKWVIILGKKVPSFLLPVQPKIFIAEKL